MAKKIILGSVNLEHVSSNYEWYSIVTNYNMEEQYVENIMNAVSGTQFESQIAEYYIPIKYILTNPDKVATENAKPKIKKEKGCYASYVFIKCKMDEGLWTLLRTTTGASVIITIGGIPVSVSDEEINNIKINQVPTSFGVEKSVQLLAQQYKKFVKIIPGINDDHPENCPEPDLEKIEYWFKQARRKTKKFLEKERKKELKNNDSELQTTNNDKITKAHSNQIDTKQTWENAKNKFYK